MAKRKEIYDSHSINQSGGKSPARGVLCTNYRIYSNANRVAILNTCLKIKATCFIMLELLESHLSAAKYENDLFMMSYV